MNTAMYLELEDIYTSVIVSGAFIIAIFFIYTEHSFTSIIKYIRKVWCYQSGQKRMNQGRI